jgi:hypothetical protein
MIKACGWQVKNITANGYALAHPKGKMFHFGLAFINMKYKKVNAKLLDQCDVTKSLFLAGCKN